MQITSTAFPNYGSIPAKYTGFGSNINPPLNIEELPEGTESLAIVVNDPDAPSGSWIHWLVWNIDATNPIIEENSIPSGSVEGTTGFDKIGYDGPCPPSGTHHYHFIVYALSSRLNLESGADKHALQSAMTGKILDQEEIIGTYQRQ